MTTSCDVRAGQPSFPTLCDEHKGREAIVREDARKSGIGLVGLGSSYCSVVTKAPVRGQAKKFLT